MANTITEGLNGIAAADLSGLQQRIKSLQDEAEKQLQLRANALAQLSADALIDALRTSKKTSS